MYYKSAKQIEQLNNQTKEHWNCEVKRQSTLQNSFLKCSNVLYPPAARQVHFTSKANYIPRKWLQFPIDLVPESHLHPNPLCLLSG